MVAALKQWELPMRSYREDWIQIISRNDAEIIWSKLFNIVSRHSAIKSLYASRDLSGENLKEMYCDLTQDLYVKLQEKARWQIYIEDGYTHEKVEHELYNIEVPNLVSRLLRQRHPESYRIARRISNILMTKKEFRCYSRPRAYAPSACHQSSRPSNKMVFQIYGLADWPPNKPVKPHQELLEQVKEVAYRFRDTRRAGRGSSSQIIISNTDLIELIVEIFKTINSPADIRTMRLLAQSKLAIDDSQIVSIEETIETSSPEPQPFKLNIVDDKPTPEEVVIEKELASQMESLADTILRECLQEVRNKSQRFRKLVEVVWHCYFNHASLSQTTVAKRLRMSDSLVSHYRKIFDRIVRSKSIGVDEGSYLNNALEKRVSEILTTYKKSDGNQKNLKPLLRDSASA
jgi:hypothetical protein